MKPFFVIMTMIFLVCYHSDWFTAQARAAQRLQIPKFNSVQEALVFLCTYPTITTQGVPLDLLVESLGISPTMLGRHIKADNHLTAVPIHHERRTTTVIFATGATPHEQINNFITTIPPARFKQGVPMAEFEENVEFKQDNWSSRQLRQSIGLHIDRERYVSHILGGKKYVFYKGYAPPQQIARYLDNMTQQQLEEGVLLTQIADKVSYRLDSWSKKSVNQSIGYNLDKDKYVVQPIYIEGEREFILYPKGATPHEQIARYLQNSHPVILRLGVPSAQIASAVNYTRKLSPVNASKSVAKRLNKETYLLRVIAVKGERIVVVTSQAVPEDETFVAGVLIDDKIKDELLRNYPSIYHYFNSLGYARHYVGIGGKYQEFIFAKNYTPPDQVNGYLDNLDPQRLKQGISVEEIANNVVKYGREDWPQEDFYESISHYLDRSKYATSFILAGNEVKTVIFAKDAIPRLQLLSYLASLDSEILTHEGVSLTQVGNNVSYWQHHQSNAEFRRSVRWQVQALEGYAIRWTKKSKDSLTDMPKGRSRTKASDEPRTKDTYEDHEDTGKQKLELRIFLAS